jgi:hypothetical protein
MRKKTRRFHDGDMLRHISLDLNQIDKRGLRIQRYYVFPVKRSPYVL